MYQEAVDALRHQTKASEHIPSRCIHGMQIGNGCGKCTAETAHIAAMGRK
jgi:hypothetical protein